MSDIDDKLHAVLHELGARYYFEGGEIDEEEYADYIKTLKQAFAEALMPLVNGMQNEAQEMLDISMPVLEAKLLDNLMTGQEFYDRFKQEFMKDETVSYNGDLLAVARRAAGIDHA